ncbi:hypothetical protein ACS0TY_032348 [Phlomoides rotata]
MTLTNSDQTTPIKFQRRQFPILLCFAMTINKNSGTIIVDRGCVSSKASIYTWRVVCCRFQSEKQEGIENSLSRF